MSIPTVPINENTPQGDSNIALGDNRIREFKTQNREILAVDHKYESSGQDADMGKHKKVSLIEQADLGTGAEGKPILGAQTVGGKAELVFTDEDNNDVQITKNGGINPTSSILNAIYPVGIVVTLGVSTNPATLFGVGTWTAIEGKVIVGKAASGTFDTLDATGGAETHTHTATTSGPSSANTATTGGVASNADNSHTHTLTTDAGNSLQPYIVKYCWQRVS